MGETVDMIEAMKETAQDLATLPTEEWAEWIEYLLEALEEEAEEEAYRDFLETLRLMIVTRLEENVW